MTNDDSRPPREMVHLKAWEIAEKVQLHAGSPYGGARMFSDIEFVDKLAYDALAQRLEVREKELASWKSSAEAQGNAYGKLKDELTEARAEIECLKTNLENYVSAETYEHEYQLRDALKKEIQSLNEQLKDAHDEGYHAGCIDATSDERIRVSALKYELQSQSALIERCEKVLRLVADDLEQIGVTPTEIRHRKTCKEALTEIASFKKGEK